MFILIDRGNRSGYRTEHHIPAIRIGNPGHLLVHSKSVLEIPNQTVRDQRGGNFLLNHETLHRPVAVAAELGKVYAGSQVSDGNVKSVSTGTHSKGTNDAGIGIVNADSLDNSTF